jgi:ABC-type uncharacterized transport system permease subunit
MDKKFGYYIFGGMLLGVFLGLTWATGANTIMGIVIGAVAGMAIGWFAAAYAMEKEKKQDK